MRLDELDEVQEVAARRNRLLETIAAVPAMVTYAVEMKAPDGVIVFSNEQPGARHKLSANVNAAVRDALAGGLYADLAAVDAELKAFGVEPPDDDPAPAAATAAARKG